MKRPTSLTLDEVLALHPDQVERYGGHHGVRLLESAISMPQATFSGNDLRAGLMAALVFLGLNGLELEADADSLTELVLGVAAGKVSKTDTTVFIERHSRARRTWLGDGVRRGTRARSVRREGGGSRALPGSRPPLP